MTSNELGNSDDAATNQRAGRGRANGERSALARWRLWVIAAFALITAVALTYLVSSLFVPRWWAQRVADMSGHGSFARGIGSGLALGVACTLVPLLLCLFAAVVWRRRAGRFMAGAATLMAVLTALPNLMTLAIKLGGNNAAHAGERILDVDAPGFRGATATGAVVAGVIFLVVTFFVIRRRHRARSARRAADGR